MGEQDVAAAVKALSNAGQRIVIDTNPEAGSRRLNDVHLQAWGRLYQQGIVTYIRAGGQSFFDLTPLGEQVRATLLATNPKDRP